MYGMVNKAFEDLVTRNHGREAWEAIMTRAAVSGPFVCMRQYPDDITYQLVAAAGEVLGASQNAVLESLGEFWTSYTVREGYGDLLDLMSGNLVDFLNDLDNLHARVGLSFPELRPPSFECQQLDDGSLRLRYTSTRPGLAPLVVGLLKGLGTMFGEDLRIVHERAIAVGCDEFLIHRHRAPPA
jgi:hypothetical protein